MATFGERLRLLRRSRNLTIDGLSELSGIESATLRTIERRGTRPTRAAIRKLAQALNAPPEVLFGERRQKEFKTSRR